MPRGGGGRSSSRGASPSRGPSPTRNTATHTQAPLRSPQTAQPQSGGMFSGLGGVLAQGMAFGAGSAIAHSAIRSVTGGGNHEQQVVQQDSNPYQAPPQQQQQQQQNQNMCNFENTQFIECLKNNGDSLSQCQSFFDMLKQCEKKYS